MCHPGSRQAADRPDRSKHRDASGDSVGEKPLLVHEKRMVGDVVGAHGAPQADDAQPILVARHRIVGIWPDQLEFGGRPGEDVGEVPERHLSGVLDDQERLHPDALAVYASRRDRRITFAEAVRGRESTTTTSWTLNNGLRCDRISACIARRRPTSSPAIGVLATA